MARAKTILQSEYPYNITARCINRDWFSLPMSTVWNIFCEELCLVNKSHSLKIHSFVLMNNHFHLIASTPLANISKCMLQFMSNTSRRLTEKGNRINQTFGGRYYKSILQKHNYYLHAYKYNYLNPVSAKIVNSVEDYEFSTLHGLIGRKRLIIPLEEDITLFSSFDETLRWLNKQPEEKRKEAVRYALKRPYYKIKKRTKYK